MSNFNEAQHARQQAGTSAGGQFAHKDRPDNDVVGLGGGRNVDSGLIVQQIGFGPLASLGMRNMTHTDTGIEFDATILPIGKRGERLETPRRMNVSVDLNARDTYDISVSYKSRGEQVTHFEREDVYANELPRTILALDWDGPEAANPRLA